MDSFIYSLVLVPALPELLPRSGIPATTANVGFYGGVLFALFLIGWGMALVWGPIADRFGRVRTMTLSIFSFSLFTLLAAFATGVWTLAIFRFLAGVGIGGEWGIGRGAGLRGLARGTPHHGRGPDAHGLLHRFFLAAVANIFIGSRFGWRYMFVVGGTPALLVAFIRRGVHEPERWENRRKELGGNGRCTARFSALFSPQYRRRTIVNSLYLIVSLVGLWAGSVYVPTAITYLAAQEGLAAARGAQLASYATALLGIGTVVGALIVPFLADWLGRQATLGIFFVLDDDVHLDRLRPRLLHGRGRVAWFVACSFLLGLGGANFIVYSFWLPEQYGTECRASAFAFITDVGRFVAAGFTFLVGAGIHHFQTLGTPVALTAFAFVIGLACSPSAKKPKAKDCRRKVGQAYSLSGLVGTNC